MTASVTRPRRICSVCGEFLPHYCAPVVTITRQKFTGRRVVIIIDRESAVRSGAA